MTHSPPAGPTRSGFAAILGAPNAGKSTLVNQLVGQKVSIVSRKVQTTRMRVRGIAVHGQSQVVLVDTPGIFAPRRRLDRAMVEAAWGSAADADAILVLVDASAEAAHPHAAPVADTKRILEGLSGQGRRAFLALNKADAVPRGELLPLAQKYQDSGPIDRIFMISGLKGDGTGDLLAALAERMPEGPWAYPADQVADLPLRLLAAEITREHLYDRLHEELPYASTVETEKWSAFKDGSVRIDQLIFVERDSQKAIVLGKSGHTVKAIGAAARSEMEKLFGQRVHLFLHVKVKENWGDDPVRYREIGLDFPKR